MLPGLAGEGMLIAQPYVPNRGTDIKVYGVGGELFATERCSPLHPDASVRERRVPLSAEVAEIAARVGVVYGLDLYGVDVLLGPDGPVVVDVNDFPSFRQVPDAAARVAGAVLELARAGGGVGPSAALPYSLPVPVSIPVQATSTQVPVIQAPATQVPSAQAAPVAARVGDGA